MEKCAICFNDLNKCICSESPESCNSSDEEAVPIRMESKAESEESASQPGQDSQGGME